MQAPPSRVPASMLPSCPPSVAEPPSCPPSIGSMSAADAPRATADSFTSAARARRAAASLGGSFTSELCACLRRSAQCLRPRHRPTPGSRRPPPPSPPARPPPVPSTGTRAAMPPGRWSAAKTGRGQLTNAHRDIIVHRAGPDLFLGRDSEGVAIRYRPAAPVKRSRISRASRPPEKASTLRASFAPVSALMAGSRSSRPGYDPHRSCTFLRERR